VGPATQHLYVPGIASNSISIAVNLTSHSLGEPGYFASIRLKTTQGYIARGSEHVPVTTHLRANTHWMSELGLLHGVFNRSKRMSIVIALERLGWLQEEVPPESSQNVPETTKPRCKHQSTAVHTRDTSPVTPRRELTPLLVSLILMCGINVCSKSTLPTTEGS